MAVKKSRKKARAATGNIDTFNNDFNASFDERKSLHEKAMSSINESHPMIGAEGSDDTLWRSLTSTGSQRDLNPMTQKRMRDISFWLWDANPMGHRIIEIMVDFIVGDGFKIMAKDESVQEVIDNFWYDPDNNMEEAQSIDVRELSLFGEICFPVWVNPANGHVKLGYLDPGLITRVTKNPRNPRMLNQVKYTNRNKPNDIKTLKIVQNDRNLRSKSFGFKTGDCLYYTINKIWSNTRGRGDLLPLADWLDGHDQFLFARLERAFLLNNYIWDITCEGMSKSDLEKFIKTVGKPKAGSVRVHNEKIKWDTVSPGLESNDASGEVNMFKNQILGGAGFPGHWFAEGSSTTRATALEMSLPVLKRLKSRQNSIKFMYKHMIDFQIDQAILHGTLNSKVDRKFTIQPDPIISRDNKGMAVAVKNFTEGLMSAEGEGWITKTEASAAFRLLLSQCGAEFDRKFEVQEKEDKKEDKKEDDSDINNKKKED